MKKKYFIAIVLWFIVAAFFYTAIWTCETNTLSQCWLFTGFVSIGQVLLTVMSIGFSECF